MRLHLCFILVASFAFSFRHVDDMSVDYMDKLHRSASAKTLARPFHARLKQHTAFSDQERDVLCEYGCPSFGLRTAAPFLLREGLLHQRPPCLGSAMQ